MRRMGRVSAVEFHPRHPQVRQAHPCLLVVVATWVKRCGRIPEPLHRLQQYAGATVTDRQPQAKLWRKL